jgi:ankyrin repeat protein
VVRLLLEAKADVDKKNRYGRTALYWAANKGHEAMVWLLLEAKADVDAKDKDGRTALYWAADKGHQAVVRLIQTSAHSPF